jgi:hypothetical protein
MIVAPELWAWLESTALGAAMRQSTWAYPAAEVVHLLGMGTLLGAVVVIDLRLLGRSPELSQAGLLVHAVPVALAGAALAIPSGFLLFTAHASTLARNAVLGVKLSLVGAAGLNALLFHRLRPGDRWARFNGVLSLVLWAGVVTCGRLLAYL